MEETDKLVLNGVEVEFDFTDADNLALLKKATQEMDRFDETDTWDENDPVAAVKHGCNGYKIFFCKVFGAEVYDRIFNGKCSLKEHKKWFVAVMDKAYEDIRESVTFDEVKAKYNPNRVQQDNSNKPKDFHRKRRR